MIRFRHQPPIDSPSSPTSSSPTVDDLFDAGFVQEVKLFDGRTLVARARWHLAPNDHGVMQVLDLVVAPQFRRKEFGAKILDECIAQAKKHCLAHQHKLRRVWLAVEQKTQVNARAFLTGHGFHHVSTIGNLLRRQDVLIYSKSMD